MFKREQFISASITQTQRVKVYNAYAKPTIAKTLWVMADNGGSITDYVFNSRTCFHSAVWLTFALAIHYYIGCHGDLFLALAVPILM